jgi:predicted ATPase/signal transduction histidine kinase
VHRLAGYQITDTVYNSDNHAIYRARNLQNDLPVVLKFLKQDNPDNSLLRSFAREYSIISSFQSELIVRAHSLEKYRNSLVMVLEDCGHVTLADIISTVRKNMKWTLGMAIRITRALEIIHRHNILFLNLRPSNIVYNSKTHSIKIIDFARAAFDPGSGIPNTNWQAQTKSLAYIAPEQTGHYDKVLDSRTDLYSLGITLYQLFTGELPFTAKDPIELLHLHLASKPSPPSQKDPTIPEPLSGIILKLLEKTRRNRYQTCAGLLSDLNRCREELEKTKNITGFLPGKNDFHGKLVFPKKLFNRSESLKQLQRALDNNTSGVIAVKGLPGIGKTELVHSFTKKLSKHSFLVVSGKYHMEDQDRPYAALLKIMQILISRILTKNRDSIRSWKQRIEETLKENCRILTDVIPDLEIIIGKHPAPHPLSPFETEQRLLRLCQDFLRLFATPARPLVIIQDNIHRADQSTLKLMGKLLTSGILENIFFIFCYRSNEIKNDHPLQATLETIKKSVPNFTTIEPPPLDKKHITQLLTELLLSEEEEVDQIAEICLTKTGGNPFFLKQFIHSLHQKKHLFFDSKTQRWNWNISDINRTKLSRNIADILIQRIETLPLATAELLQSGACIGKSFTMDTLAAVVDKDINEIWPHIEDLCAEGLLIADEKTVGKQKTSQKIIFGHDQIQELAYSLLEKNKRKKIHLKTGRFLQKQADATTLQKTGFDMVFHLNQAVSLITSQAEKLALAKANLKAARVAKNTASRETAFLFLQTALSLLPENCWQDHYNLTLEIHMEASEAAYLNRNYEETERLFKKICENAISFLDKIQAYHIRVKAQKSNYNLTGGIETCLEALDKLGVRLPKKPSSIFATLLFFRTRILLIGKDLETLPETTDIYCREIMKFLMEISTIAYYSRPKLLPFITLKAIQLSLKYGNTRYAPLVGYPTYGLLLCGIHGGSIKKGCAFGKLALNISDLYGQKKTDVSAAYLVNNLIVHWKDHIRKTLSPLLAAFRECREQGELELAVNAAYSYSYRLYYLGHNLNRTQQELSIYREEIAKHTQPIALHRQNLYCQAVSNLKGENDFPEFFHGKFYNEEEMIPLHIASGDLTTLFQLYLLKAIHSYLFNHFSKALDCLIRAKKWLPAVFASIFVPIYYFYDSLIRLALYEKAPQGKQLRYRLIISSNQKKMKNWAHHSPENYHHKFILVEAERARISENHLQAVKFYDQAIKKAKSSGYLQEEALGLELASRYYSSLDQNHLAGPYTREARFCYYKWGATAKVRQLDRQNRSFLKEPHTIIPRDLLSVESEPRFDAMAVFKASQILTEETTFYELLKKVLKILLESSGAQKGVLVFKEEDNWLIKAVGTRGSKTIELPKNMRVDSQQKASSGVLNYVIQTENSVILDDATREGLFTGDRYITEKGPRSILCKPLFYRKNLICIIYLENNLTTRAFSPDRQALIGLLGDQAAINMRNSRLFSELENTVVELNEEIRKRKKIQLQLLHSEKLSALGRLSSSIAHEFGNPLMGVKYLLSDLVGRPYLNDEDRELIELGIEECERMKKLLKDIGQFNKPTSGKKESISMHNLMDNVLLLQDKFLKSRNLGITKKYNATRETIYVVPDQISQVLLNLTINAADATSEKGGTITVTTENRGEDIHLSIVDTGTGIDPVIRDNIFEPFFSTKHAEDGTGLGLSISYGIVKQHRGTLSFDSEPGKGTVFTLTLPLTE